MKFAFTSFENPEFIDKGSMATIGDTIIDGMEKTYRQTEDFAHKTFTNTRQPENTRANPADRVKSFIENISWKNGEGDAEKRKKEVLKSDKYKQSMVLLIHCVLASVYGEKITLEPKSVAELKQDQTFPSRGYYVDEMVNALYGEENEKQKIEMDRGKIIYIYRKLQGENKTSTMIGLLSPAGPIPAVNYSCTLKHPVAKLSIATETVDTQAILNTLTDQDKAILKYWIAAYKPKSAKESENTTNCDLYDEIDYVLGDIKVSNNLEAHLEIEQLDTIYTFPSVKGYKTDAILADTITLAPIDEKLSDTKKFSFGYGSRFTSLVQGKKNGTQYVYIPPLTQAAVAWSNGQDSQTKTTAFKIEQIESQQDTITDKNAMPPVTTVCQVSIQGITVSISKTYTEKNIQYIDWIPTIDVYGPSPKFGWIASRDIRRPAKDTNNGDSSDNPINVSKVEFTCDNEPLQFTRVRDGYSLYHGVIPQWLGISIERNTTGSVDDNNSTGDWLGAVPVRAITETQQEDWENEPPFVHETLPNDTTDESYSKDKTQSNDEKKLQKMTVAVDIGSSRSVVRFSSSGVDRGETLIKEKQQLSIRLMMPPSDVVEQDKKGNNEITFEHEEFLPQQQYKAVTGKTPLGVFMQREGSRLFQSGKATFLDPKTIKTETPIRSNIKANLKEEEKGESVYENAMKLLLQSLLTSIVDRSIRLGCSEIEIRTAYLPDQKVAMENIWGDAIQYIQGGMPEKVKVKIRHISYLPESLAIANKIIKAQDIGTDDKKLDVQKGAALVDIGDFSTDIALLQKDGDTIKVVKNISIHFAGQNILLKPIWDFLSRSSEKNELLKSIFNIDPNDEEMKSVRETLSKTLSETGSNNKPDVVRNNLLCLISRLNLKGPSHDCAVLRHLVTIGYLAEFLLLKRIIETSPLYEKEKTNGSFDIHFFGGGSTFFITEKEKLNWPQVFGSSCKTHNHSADGNILAAGLLCEKAESLNEETSENIPSAATKKENEQTHMTEDEESKEFRCAYDAFVNAAKTLQDNAQWVYSQRSAQKDAEDLFKIDENLWNNKYGDAKEFADGCIKNCTDDFEIKKILFAYKMAYYWWLSVL